jgi:hypothetical protein
MPDFLDRQHTLDIYWRAIILFGRNVASYKFALAKSLVEISAHVQTAIHLEELAIPFSKNIVEHLQIAPKQAISRSSRFLDACKKAGQGEIRREELIDRTVSLGFNNVIDAFHVVNGDEIPVRFFRDERKNGKSGIRLTDEIFRLREMLQFKSLPSEVEARWRLVETAWQLNLPKGLVIGLDEGGSLLTAPTSGRRIAVTRSRDALNGYQKGKCFYCFSDIAIEDDDDSLGSVDHFLPWVLQRDLKLPVDGVWNLVLACQKCNRGIDGKSSRIPVKRLLERLHNYADAFHRCRESIVQGNGRACSACNLPGPRCSDARTHQGNCVLPRWERTVLGTARSQYS